MTHLTLEQCEKLKLWGIPQDTEYQIQFVDSKEHVFYCGGSVESVAVACPNLEDLIGWLGNDFGSLHNRSLLPDRDADFQAKSMDGNYGGYGLTPFEAVYNLCKAVHRNMTTNTQS